MMSKNRPTLALLGALAAALASTGVPASAQLRQPEAELTLVVPRQTIQPGRTVTLRLMVELPDEIHVQSDNPREDYLIPTVLDLTLPEGVTVEDITYPEASDWYLEGQAEPLAVFGSEFTIEARLALAADVPPGTLVVPGRFRYQACDDRICFIPKTAPVEWRLSVQPGAFP